MAFGDPGATPPRAGQAQYTGRYLLVGREPNDPNMAKMVRDKAGLVLASSSDFPRGPMDMTRFGGADGIYLERLGVAVTRTAPDQMTRLTAPGAVDLLTVERERIVIALPVPRPVFLTDVAPATGGPSIARRPDSLVCTLTAPGRVSATAAVDESAATWGLAATGVLGCAWTGRGVRVAVLDTGFDATHPEFAGRQIQGRSFIDGESERDGHGHGTHCIGTALGAARPPALPRYGVAPNTEIYFGKVLGDSGHGSDGAVLAGIDWAVGAGCRVVSMSLGTAAQPGDAYSQVYETAAKRALDARTILIAAAGNESDRHRNQINPVGHPADCPSIMAVGAVDSDMKIAYFSTRGTQADGGAVDVAAPGVDVYSTMPMPRSHGKMSGTSMACPHVAGIAALYVEANPTATAREIWQMLVRNAKRLDLDAADVGAGLVQAPR